MDRRNEVFPDITLHGYTLESCLGHGTLTTVYRARQQKQEPHSTALVAFLRLPATLPTYTQWHFRERFWKYVEQMETLQHPHLVPLAGYGERNTACYFLTEEVPGIALSTMFTRKTHWSPHEALAILTPLVEALTYLHQQHLVGFFFDPAYVQLLDPNQSSSLKLVLAGLCLPTLFRRIGLEQETANTPHLYVHLQSLSGNYLGQANYLAPEIIKGQDGTIYTDTYALGVLLFTLLSGTPPFVGRHYLEIIEQQLESPLPSLHELVPGLPIRLEVVVNRALSRDPALRFPSPAALLTAYKKSLEEQESAEQQAFQLFQHVYTITGTSTRSRTLSAIPAKQTLLQAPPTQQIETPLPKFKGSSGEAEEASQEEDSISEKKPTDTEKMHLHLSRMMQRLQQQQEKILQTRSQGTSPIPPVIPPVPAAFVESTEWLN